MYGDRIENSMAAPIKEIHETCYVCHGIGQIYMSGWQLKDLLCDKFILEKAGFRELLSIYRQWKHNGGFAPCEECDGSGSWIRYL